MKRDRLFTRVVYLLTAIVVLYGAGIVAVLLFVQPDESVVLRFISSMGTIFSGLLGMCTGYLMGTTRAEKNENGDGPEK